MKKFTNLFALMLCFVLLPALIFAQTFEMEQGLIDKNGNKTMAEFAEKPVIDYSYKYTPSGSRMGGEDIGSAVVIPALPFNDAGNTCSSIDDYDEACPYTGSTSPDVVYSYTPPANDIIDIDLCNSGYDTKVFVYENAWTPGSAYACNDDACPGWRSFIDDLPITAGNTYYIVIDGYGGGCGDYVLDITSNAPPPPCPPITAFPFVEDFEGTFLPDCWSKTVQSGNNITQSDYTDHTTGIGFSARFSSFSYSPDYNQYLFSPAMTIEDAHRVLSFWHKKYNGTGELLEWGVSTTTNPNDFVWMPVDLSTDWQQTNVFLTEWVGQTVYIGFHYYGDYLYYVYLDDVEVTATPPVPLSNWAIVAGVLMIGTFLVIRFRKKLA